MSKETMILGKKEYEVENAELHIEDLKFYVDNPRVTVFLTKIHHRN